MGRRFTAASSERIVFGTAGLAGLNFTFGTQAVLMWRSVDTGTFESMTCTNDSVGASHVFAINDGGDLLHVWDNTNESTAMVVPTGAPILVGFTKVTGSVAPRFHMYRFDTNVWTHSAGSLATVNSAALTSLVIGAQKAAGNEPFSGEMFAVGIWQGLVMTDSEFERLARGNWLSLAPNFYEQYSDGREVGDTGRTLGNRPSRQTARTGTTRGVQKCPAGFRMAIQRRRR